MATADVSPDLGPRPTPSAPRPSLLGWSIATAALCFLPLGLVAVYHSLRCASLIEAADLEGAARARARAKNWLIAAVVIGLLVDLFILLVLLLLGAFAT
jgi:hypothetical protein